MKQLTLKKKISYSMGGLALNLANLAISQWLLKLYVPNKNEALVGSLLFSAIFLIGRVVDGVMDPVIGYISDNFKSKWGRRIPFILFMTIPCALVSFLLWTPPFPNEFHWVNAVYIFILVQLFFIFWTLLANPYMSLLPEITSDIKERVNITTMQAAFLMLGTLIFGILGPIKEAIGWIGIGLAVGGITIISFFPTVLAIKEKPTGTDKGSKEKMKFSLIFEWAKNTFKNHTFIFVLVSTSLFWFSLNLIILIIPFWCEHALGLSDAYVVFLMAPFLLANLVFFFVFNFLSKKYGKYKMFLITLLGSSFAMAGMYFIGDFAYSNMIMERNLTMILNTIIMMAVIGTFVSGFMMLPFAILSDVIDYDETLTGKRREGIYFGMQSIFQKTSIGISIAVATPLMYYGGFKTPTVQGLKIICLIAAIFAVFAFIAFLRYPIREKDGKTYLVR